MRCLQQSAIAYRMLRQPSNLYKQKAKYRDAHHHMRADNWVA